MYGLHYLNVVSSSLCKASNVIALQIKDLQLVVIFLSEVQGTVNVIFP